MSARSALCAAIGVASMLTIGSLASAQVSRAPRIGAGNIAADIDIKGKHLELVKRPQFARERKQVFDWVDRDLILATPSHWSRPSRDIAARYPKSALAVERTRRQMPATCTTFYDRIDLKMARTRGFRLVGFEAEPLVPPPGHAMTSPVEAIAVNTAQGDVYTAALLDADQIRIRPPLFAKQAWRTNTCWSGYRLTVTLEGPRGASPFGDFRRPSNRGNR